MRGQAILLALIGALAVGEASASWYWPFGTNSTGRASASWYWPFGTNSTGKADAPRLSELMEPASRAIDDATDLINDGKNDEAVEKYREALRLLDRLELEHPERAATPEFQSVRNKRAYVDAQLNAILLEEARLNAKAVAVTDTTGLEEKLKTKRAEEAKRKKAEADDKKTGLAKDSAPKLESQLEEYMEDARARSKKITRAAATAKFERESEEKIAELLKADPKSQKARIMRAGLELYRKNYGNVRKELDLLLATNPDDVSALNLLAAVETATGNFSAAEAALVRAIRADEKDYHAYYNLAKLLCRKSGERDKVRAERFYRQGRKAGGPADPYLDKTFAPEEDE